MSIQANPVDVEVFRHLARGWQGFIGIMLRLSSSGIKLPDDELARLERMQGEMAALIASQHALRERKS